MKALSAITKLGLFAFILVMLNEVMSHSMWGTSVPNPPSTLDFALSLYGDEWAIATVILGALLAMAMVGSSYLVRDERLVNLIWDMGVKSNDRSKLDFWTWCDTLRNRASWRLYKEKCDYCFDVH